MGLWENRVPCAGEGDGRRLWTEEEAVIQGFHSRHSQLLFGEVFTSH